jgi:hypothetical protein
MYTQNKSLTLGVVVPRALLHQETKMILFIIGTLIIIALCDIFKKIARTGRFYFEKCHPVMCNLFK